MNKIGLTAFVDLLCGLLMFVLLMVNPEAKEAESPILPPGNLIVTASWQAGDSDVDLWLMGPGEEVPVGYSNKNGSVWDLLRDDLGITTNDNIGINYENAFSHGLPDGEYIINVHAYGITDPFPFTVEVEVAINSPTSGGMQQVVNKSVVFDVAGEEITVIRFMIKDGKVVAGSQHEVPETLRGETK